MRIALHRGLHIVMPFLIVLIVVAVTVAAVALQNGHAVTVSFLFWQFDAPLVLVILGATVAGLGIGGALGFARAVRCWGKVKTTRASSSVGP